MPTVQADFLESVDKLATVYIRDRFAGLTDAEQQTIRQLAIRVVGSDGDSLRRNEKLRSGAVRLIVALLPDSVSALENVLTDVSSPLWYEVHFTIFAALCRDDLSQRDQARMLGLIRRYLLTIASDAGYAAWKAGGLLGDEWRSPETIRILGELLSSASHVAGRSAAIHGIEHALHGATAEETAYLVAVIQNAMRSDRSPEIRRKAEATLKGAGCGPTPDNQ